MGKSLIQQRRGRGTSTFRARSHAFVDEVLYPSMDAKQADGVMKGEVVDFTRDCARTAPLAKLALEDGTNKWFLPPEGSKIGDTVEFGKTATISLGNVLPLREIPDGMPVYNIEIIPGDGGKMVRSAGSVAYIVSHIGGKVFVRMPSKKVKQFDVNSRATIGNVAGGGAGEKPIVKAGKKFFMIRAHGSKVWPRSSGNKMNVCNHPFGGSNFGKPAIASHSTPPGRKVGKIAARRTGRKG